MARLAKGNRISGPGVIGTAYHGPRDAKLRGAGFRSANHEDRPLDYPNEEWQHKGATLSDKTARQEFGLTQDEIHDAINAGTLQYRQAAFEVLGGPCRKVLPVRRRGIASAVRA